MNINVTTIRTALIIVMRTDVAMEGMTMEVMVMEAMETEVIAY